MSTVTSVTPLRVTLGGGGSDLHAGGVCVSATIDKYVTVTVADGFDPTYVLHYSEAETAQTVADVKHPLLRRVLERTGTPPGVQIATIADIPAGTGLGSSGAFTVGLLRALLPEAPRPTICRLACELDLGQQDQWAATYGGVNVYDFSTGSFRPVETTIDAHLELFYTGIKHDAAAAVPAKPIGARTALHLAATAVTALEGNDPRALGCCLSEQWQVKYRAAPSATHDLVDEWIRVGVDAGAYGGKLIGAGDGGFLMFATDRPLADPMRNLGLRQLPFRFEHEGCRCM